MTRALILVDIQNDYFADGRFPLSGMAAAADRAGDALAHARSTGMDIVHVRHEMPMAGAPFFEAGTPGAEIHPSVAPDGDETVVTKHFPNSFRETGLDERLRGAGVDEVVVVGAQSNLCIDATSRAARDLGFAVTVLHDACAAKEQTFGDEQIPAATVHGAFMAALSPSYASLSTVADFVAAD